MATKTRDQREAELLRMIQTQVGREQLRDHLKNRLGLQVGEPLPPGTSLVHAVLNFEFGPTTTPQ